MAGPWPVTACRWRHLFCKPAHRSLLISHVLLPLLVGAAQGQSGVAIPILPRLPASVRSAGLAGANAAVIGDAGSVFTNPAGLATIKHISVEAGFLREPGYPIQTMGAAAVRIGPFDFGGGYHYLRFADSAAVKDNLIWVGTGVYRIGLIALGASSKYVSLEDSAGMVSRALTTDAGMALAVFDIMAFAVSVQNIGNRNLSGQDLSLPTTTHVGFTLNFVDPQSNARVLGTIEEVWTRGSERHTLLGAEAGLVFGGIGIVGRIGHGAQPSRTRQSETAFGGSLVLGRLSFDYAYQRRSALGLDVQRFGARWTP